MSVHPQCAAVDLIEPHQQVYKGGLAAAGRTDQRDALPRLDLEVHILNQGYIVLIAEPHMLKGHAAGTVGQAHGIGGIGDDRCLIDQIKHPLRTGQRILQLGHDIGDVIEGLCVLVGIVQKDAQLADRDTAGNRNKCAQYADRGVNQ